MHNQYTCLELGDGKTLHSVHIEDTALSYWAVDSSPKHFFEGVEYWAQYMLGALYIRYNKLSTVWLVQHNTVQPAV
jgi:hypothetical protein